MGICKAIPLLRGQMVRDGLHGIQEWGAYCNHIDKTDKESKIYKH